MVVIAASACRPSGHDDRIAREFMSRVRHHDSTAMALVESNPEMRRAGWGGIGGLTAGLGDSTAQPQLLEWERGQDPRIGSYRKLTYFVGRSPDSAVVELYLVDRDGRTLVNTVRARPYSRLSNDR